MISDDKAIIDVRVESTRTIKAISEIMADMMEHTEYQYYDVTLAEKETQANNLIKRFVNVIQIRNECLRSRITK